MTEEKQGVISTMITIQDATGNPAPLGLMGFGMTTVLLNLANAGIYSLGSMILAMGVFYGGLAQIIAGIEEWKKKNTFGATAFTSYGAFWLSLVALIFFPKWGWIPATDKGGMVAYFIMWGIFTFIMFIGTLRLNRALQVVFFTLFILFFLLAIGEGVSSPAILTIAGWEGIICGLSAIYAGLAQVLNEIYGRTVWPLGTK
ncbi:MAG: acetate uptake transporter [Deltaproteobacteria bacterium]|jgi:succinate-acetate transporter protein|nr:acetate uptake transporter [Deltaproteobacteria bacterium]MCL5879765.1 acetate uptake transporter [Deltaproteobacteria bacterium]MDA8304742.1 acetate uptake transporter [Deltaproteobacteria bacterium]